MWFLTLVQNDFWRAEVSGRAEKALGWGLLLSIRRCLNSGYRIRAKEVKAASLKHGTSRDFMRADISATPF